MCVCVCHTPSQSPNSARLKVLTLTKQTVQSLLDMQTAVVKCSTQFGHYKVSLIKFISLVIEYRNFRGLATVREEYTCNNITRKGIVKEIPAARGQTGRDALHTYQQGNTWYFRSLKKSIVGITGLYYIEWLQVFEQRTVTTHKNTTVSIFMAVNPASYPAGRTCTEVDTRNSHGMNR